jgi:hypothetical protein
MTEEQATPPKLPAIYLSGPMPTGMHLGWCATCVMVYMGTVSSEPELQQYARDLFAEARKAGAGCISIDLAERDDLLLQPAITVGPSTLYRVPDAGAFNVDGTPAYKWPELPVCWTHIKGMPPAVQQARTQQGPPTVQSRLIQGKSYGQDQYKE